MTTQDQRPYFYEGQYLGADDVNAIVTYDHEQVARHELGAHSWGIAAGLVLIERPTPGAPRRVNVFLTPGMATDGFGRKLDVLAPMPLPQALFANIPFAADVDDPAATGGTPPGRAVKIWLGYDEQSGGAPGAGFAACDAGDSHGRIQADVRFLVGDLSTLHRVSIAGQMVDATAALGRTTFDPSAPLLADESVPQQALPTDNLAQRWPVPVGIVRWVAGKNGGGYFVARDVDATAAIPDAIRRCRRYIGSIAATVQAPDGAIVLRDRLAVPRPGSFGASLLSAAPVAATLADLVWIEGNLRAVGDVRLAGGALQLTDTFGRDQGTPLSIEREGDAGAGSSRTLRAVIGDADLTSRFAVASVKTDPDPIKNVYTERFNVLAGGNVGIATAAPTQRLHVTGERIRLENAGKIVDLQAVGPQVGLESSTADVKLRAAGPHNLLLNCDCGDGNVGVGTGTPGGAYKLDVRARQIKLGLEEGGGGQLILGGTADRITLSGLNATGFASAAAIQIGGLGPTRLDQFSVNARSATAIGDELLLQDATGAKRIRLFTAGSEVDLLTDTHALSLRAVGHNCLINWLPGDGRVGIGTGNPATKLHVDGDFVRIDGLGGERAYLGGDGSANDVQLGSFSAGVTMITCWNAATSTLMSLHAANVSVASDATLKTNVRPLENPLDAVCRLRGIRFDWRHHHADGNRGSIGFLAHEVEQVFPELVGQARSYATVSYSGLVPVLAEAIKELKRDNDSLREDLKALADTVSRLVAEGKTATRAARKPSAKVN